MDGFDLDIRNYSVDDLKNFLNIDALTFDYTDLQKSVQKKIAQITGISRYSDGEKKTLVNFVNQINLRLVEAIKQENKIQEYHRNPNLEIKNPTTQYEFSSHKKETSNKHETKKILTHLSIDTKFRKNYLFQKSTDFYIDLPVALKNVLSMRLESFEINNTIYNISESKKTNKFYIKKTGGTTNGELVITIPDGNYDETTLANYLNNTTATNLLNSIGVKVKFNETSKKTRFISVDNSGNEELSAELTLSFDYESKCGESNIEKSQEQFKEAPERNINSRVDCKTKTKCLKGNNKKEKRITTTSLGWLLGYRKETYSKNGIIESECFFDFNILKYMFLCINDFQKSLHEVVKIVYDNSFLEKNILARIPMSVNLNEKLFIFHETETFRKRNYFGPVTIKRMHIQLIDEYGQKIDLNGGDFSFNLEFEVLYERNI